MKKYNEFIKENNNTNIDQMLYELKIKISGLKNWLYMDDGLGMKNIIFHIFNKNKYYTEQSNLLEEKNKFYKDLEILKLTGYPKSAINNKEYRVNNMSIVKTIQNGEFKWHPVSKLNTNYRDLTDLLVYVIGEMLKDNDFKGLRKDGQDLYNNIMDDPKSALLNFKNRLTGAISYYLITKSKENPVNGKIGLGDFMIFTKNTIENSKRGQIAEDNVEKLLLSNNFTIPVKGGDGDFIDMIYGVDMVAYRVDHGYKSIQIKTFTPNDDLLNRYETDWFINYNNGYPIITDIKTKDVIKI